MALLGETGEPCAPEKTGRVRYLLAQAQRGVGRAARLSSQLLTFARGGDPVLQPIDVRPVIAEAVEFAFHGSECTCRMRLDTGLRLVAGDGAQLHQVFTNIALNARQAMPRGGELTVAAGNVTIAPGHPSLKPGEYVRVSLADTGIGIPEDVLPNVCDPYFTTKQSGSGLGLSSAFAIAHKHGGWLGIESCLGSGTTVQVYLPVAAAPEAAVREEGRGLRGGRALVMDDEQGLWPVTDEMLQCFGFQTVCVPGGEEMLRAYEEARRGGRPFDVVILDLVIRGGMGGEAAVRELLKLDPGARAVVSSGYADAPVLARFRDYGFRAALPKPYSHRVLALVLEEALG
jgi:CheY-like chemotaxis protein